MKLYYLSNSTIPSRAANSIHVMQMCNAFSSAGHDVTLFAGKGNQHDKDLFSHYGIPSGAFHLELVTRPNVPIAKSLLYANQVARRLKQMPTADVLYARDPFSLWQSNTSNTPLIYEAHSGPTSIRRWIEPRLFACRTFSHLVVISEALKQTYEEDFWKGSAVPVVVAHDAASLPDELPEIDVATRVGSLQVGYVGHLYAGRGIELIEDLAKQLPECDFHLIGGNEKDIQQARTRNASQRNLIIHGYVPPKDVAAYRAKMDVLLAPYQQRVATAGGGDTSRWMSPLKIFEYMSAGKAIVASDLPVLREVLADGANCLLAEPTVTKMWRSAIERLKDEGLRATLGKRAFDDYSKKHTWRARADDVLSYVSGVKGRV